MRKTFLTVAKKHRTSAALPLHKFVAASAVVITAVGALTLPAFASTLAYDFTGTPVSIGNSAPNGSAYSVNVLTTAVTLTVSGLGVFDDGSTGNIDTSGNGHSDTIYIGSGTAPLNYTSYAGAATSSVTITGVSATQVGDWAFGSIGSLVLNPGTYWVGVVYGNPNGAVYSTSSVTTQAGLAITGGDNCGLSASCGPDSPVTFGPNFEDTPATPLPGTLPLFAAGLGFVGYLSRRKNRTHSLAALINSGRRR